MSTRSIMWSVVLVGLLLCVPALAPAQIKVVNKLRIVNNSTNAVVTLEAPSALSENQTFTFPVAAGSVGQVMTTSSSGGGLNPMQWTSIGSSATALSERKGADVDYLPSVTDSALIVAVESNKSYRVAGLLHLGRLNDNTPSDNFQVKVTAPTGSTRLLYGLRCFDCPAGTTGVPSVSSGTTIVTSGTIDPAGSSNDDYTTRVYSIEGILDTGSTDGFVTLSIIEPASATNTLRIGVQSALVLTEVD